MSSLNKKKIKDTDIPYILFAFNAQYQSLILEKFISISSGFQMIDNYTLLKAYLLI